MTAILGADEHTEKFDGSARGRDEGGDGHTTPAAGWPLAVPGR